MSAAMKKARLPESNHKANQRESSPLDDTAGRRKQSRPKRTLWFPGRGTDINFGV
jgi:hypothetical protein